MSRFLKVETYCHPVTMLYDAYKPSKTLVFPFDEDRIHFKTSKGWLFAEVRNETHLGTAMLDHEPLTAEDVFEDESYRVMLNAVNCPYVKAMRTFDDIDIYLSVYTEERETH